MKKVIVPFFIFLAIIIFALFQNGFKEKQANAKSLSTEEKIEQFIGATTKNEKIKSIETKVTLNKDYSALLFVQNNNNVGYAIMKNDKPVTVTHGDNKQSEDQFKKYFIVYGEKPTPSNTKLTVNIDLGNNREDIEKSFELQGGKYYLCFSKLPKDVQNAKVGHDDYVFE